MDDFSLHNNEQVSDEISVVELFFRYLKSWKLFAVSVFICLCVAYVYLLFTAPMYMAMSKVLISDKTRGQSELDMMTAFDDLGIFSQKNNLDNEIEVLRSETLLRETYDSLRLGFSYFKKIRFKKIEIYKESPLMATIQDQQDIGEFEIDTTATGALVVRSLDNDFLEETNFDQQIMTPCGLLTLTRNPYGSETFPIILSVNHPDDIPLVSIAAINKTSSVVEMSIVTNNMEKGRDILNTLVAIYNIQAISDKNYVAINTIDFINERLKDISGELKEAEIEVETYRRSHNVMDIQEQGRLLLNTSASYTTKINEAQTLLAILNSTKSFISNPANAHSIIPSNDGLTDVTVLSLIKTYNQEILDKERETVGMRDNNSLVKDFNKRISSIRENLLQGINISIASTELTIKELRRHEGMYSTQASLLPTQERESRELFRQQDIKATIVNYLMQKKEETALSLALATPNAKVIDPAISYPSPVKPRKMIIMLAALIIGFVIPIVWIYLRDLFDTKVHSMDVSKKIIKAPFLGEIPFTKDKSPFPVLKTRSLIAEKFRLVVSNLEFIAGGEDKTRFIAITSTAPADGKSFFSRNLALSLAMIGKKTLLLDIDLRKSVTKDILDIKKEKGTTLFLAEPATRIEEVINPAAYNKNLDILPVKVYPPNPAELLASDRLPVLFSEIQKLHYDYVIVDTAPITLVSDVFLINRYVQTNIFVVRTEHTEKSALSEIQDYYKDNKLKSISWIMNGISKRGYGNADAQKYGYYYSEDSLTQNS
jgi:capsular exopolysaccharide synthesis family protein